VNNSESPQQTLQNYFDDLLNDVQEALPVRPVSAANPLPLQVTQTAKAANTQIAEPQFAEPNVETDHKARVEKLLQTVVPQVEVAPVKAAPAPAVAPTKKRVPKAPLPPVRSPLATPPKIQVATPSPQVAPELPGSRPVVEPPPRHEPKTDVKTPPTAEPPPPPVQEENPAEVASAVENAAVEDTAVAENHANHGLQWLENGRPAWAQDRFDVLLFTVSGLTLAVPLIALGQIQPLNDQLTPIFGQADWFMGLQPTAVGKIRTVNTAKFVMPERYDKRFLETAQYVISIDGLPWGLAVDTVNQPITLSPDDVKWRSERSKRAWLAGTVKEHMCALLDIPMMGKLLMDTDKNLRQGGPGGVP